MRPSGSRSPGISRKPPPRPGNDPLAEASKERVRALETAAQVRLGDSAPIWLDQQHPVLGGTSPRTAAAADVDGFERAISLLQAPTALAA